VGSYIKFQKLGIHGTSMICNYESVCLAAIISCRTFFVISSISGSGSGAGAFGFGVTSLRDMLPRKQAWIFDTASVRSAKKKKQENREKLWLIHFHPWG
jgi:hypothetical protein